MNGQPEQVRAVAEKRSGYWAAYRLNFFGFRSLREIGIGDTPEEAYQDLLAKLRRVYFPKPSP